MRNSTSLNTLYVHRFRPFEDVHFEFGPSLNIIVGPNARGKTSLLEAIYVLMSGASFRTSKLSDLIRAGSDYFHLETGYKKRGVGHRLKVFYSEKERRVVDNNTISHGLGSLPGILPGVVMSPEDIAIIKGAPQSRRDFLDTQISQVDPLYLHYLYRYHRSMRQRNVLLKHRQIAAIEGWEHEMAYAAAYLIQKRAETVNMLKQLGGEYYSSIGETSEVLDLKYSSVDCDYTSQSEIAKSLLHHYGKLRVREMEQGNTFTGPHRDDLVITVNGQEARHFASEGQQRTCVAALQCAVWMKTHQEIGEKPLMLIDDLGMGLDKMRQERLISHLCTLGQVFVTTTSDMFTHALPRDKWEQITL